MRRQAPELSFPFGLQADHVSVQDDRELLLDDVSLICQPGDFIALTGANGSGKTTLLNILAGRGFMDRPPTGGRVSLGNIDLYALNDRGRTDLRSRHISYVGQNPKLGLFPNETVETNLRLSSALRGRELNEQILEDAVAYYGFGRLMRRQAGKLSGGQQQLIPIIKAELTDPALFLLDEPTAALSQETGDKVNERLASLTRTAGKMAVIVTHEQEPAASRVIHLEHGRITPSWSRETIYQSNGAL